MEALKIIWANQAKLALKEIYSYYKEKSLPVAQRIKSELLDAPKTIVFAKQYQVDDINSKFRRIVVRHYKVLYQENNGVIQIVDIISSRQSPELLKNIV